MSFTPRKYKDIFDEMRAMSQVVTDFEVGSVARTLYESFAFEMALLYEKMNLVYLSAYVDTAQGNQLDQVVAVLGIQRSQPDYAEGSVTFLRDGAGQEILIPTGTLIATVETAAGEKKVYQTSKEATMGATQTSVAVQVRAIERGEEQETAAETVVVMPRPVPGIKFVNNDAPMRLVGKRRETDDELRDRAKNALISSGKATVISIENALLSLAGVRDARVKENFHFARSLVRITSLTQGTAHNIPRGSKVKFTFLGKEIILKTLDPVSFSDAEAIGTAKQVKAEVLVEGRAGECFNVPPTPVTWDNGAFTPLFAAALLTEVRLEDFGLIEVYVDAPKLDPGVPPAEEAAERKRIEAEIERVRAAGIFSILKSAGKVETSAVFRIELSPSLSLTPEERKEFEETVEDEIVSFMGELRMGKPLLYGKLVKAILSLENIENLVDFQGTVTRTVENVAMAIDITFSDPDKFIAVEDFERIQAGHICVASEDKDIKVHVAYRAQNLTPQLAEDVYDAVNLYLTGLPRGTEVSQNAIGVAIDGILPLAAGTLSLRPETWCPGPVDDPRILLLEEGGDTTVVVTYVEKPIVGIVFGYADELEITGAIKLVHPLNISEADKNTARTNVYQVVDSYLEKLAPEEDVVFDDLVALVQVVPQVLAAAIESGDFRAVVGGLNLPNVIDKTKVDVGPLQRAFRKRLCVSGGTEKVNVSLQALSLTMGNASASLQDRDAVKLAVRNAFNNALAGFKVGDDVVFASFKGSLENLVNNVPYTVAAFSLQATSLSDGRLQTANMGSPIDLHIRSIELAVIVPIQVGDILLTN
jgi:hypothetical protein